ncbi:MAG: prepilin-type N-terminal cleavage/methylation domain-containing protein [Planctomycetota bacterium]|nr:prepilin-type N-terminal cleavage/methylation domain-containing protein [Planctomycetota bacterium]
MRRGLTFIEVIIATALLCALAALLIGGVSFLQGSAARERHKLNGMEVAHRVVAQYLDNPDILPPSDRPIQQGSSFYRYAMREEVLVQEEGAAANLGRRRARQSGQLSVEESLPAMLNRVTVEVYLDDPGNPVINALSPVATLERIYNPISGRDEDASLEYLLRMVQRMEIEQAEKARGGQNGGAK